MNRGKNPTIIDVATHAGASKSVVSRVLNGAPGVASSTRQRVLSTAEELGYVANAMAQGMVAHRTHTLGVFVRNTSRSFYGHLLTAMQERAGTLGYRIVATTGSGTYPMEEERRGIDTLLALQVEGLIVCSGKLPTKLIEPASKRVPTVIAGRPESGRALSSVYCDERSGGYGMADHVYSLGHRKVAVFTVEAKTSMTLSPRTKAMAKRLRKYGVDVSEVAVDHWQDTAVIESDINAALATGATCLMTPSDRRAIAALEVLQRLGVRTPEDVSVTGYDGVGDEASPVFGVTSWHQPTEYIGTAAVDEVIAQIEGDSNGGRHQALEGWLLPGRTAGPA